MMGAINIGGPYFNIADVSYPATYAHDLSTLPSEHNFYVTTASECVESLSSDTIYLFLFLHHNNEPDGIIVMKHISIDVLASANTI